MGAPLSLVGQKFGMLTVIKRSGERNGSGNIKWLVRCDCGNTKLVAGAALKNGNSTSCGCIKYVDLAGRRFGRLVALRWSGKTTKSYTRIWVCKCDCGKETKAWSSHLTRGLRISCGCALREAQRFGSITHGNTVGRICTPTYVSWRDMLKRCRNKNTKSYPDYGGRGIKVCKSWLKFENFLADMGDRHAGMSLDRIDNDKGYYKENCRWATKVQQANNRRKRRWGKRPNHASAPKVSSLSTR